MYASTEGRNRKRVRVLGDKLYREDASEAVQFAFAAFIEKFDPDSGAPPLAWATLVVKRECWAKRKREHLDRRADQEAERGGEGPDVVIDALPSRVSGAEQLVEQVEEARAKLVTLKPQELRAMTLLAAGYSYAEIGELNSGPTRKRTAASTRAAPL